MKRLSFGWLRFPFTILFVALTCSFCCLNLAHLLLRGQMIILSSAVPSIDIGNIEENNS